MENLISVLIGIQARSNNSRLPKKCFEPLGGKRLLDHVIDNCDKALSYSNRYTYKKNYTVEMALLVPEDDPIKRAFGGRIRVIEGSELDVLGRFMKAKEIINPDYICRITGDCPLIPPYIITKHIALAIACKYDYVSNVDADCRLSLDGIDCEVVSARMMDWLDANAKTDSEREHVTILARTNPPTWANRGFTATFFDQSDIKLSVDTPEDLIKVREQWDSVHVKLRAAERVYGRHNVHRF